MQLNLMQLNPHPKLNVACGNNKIKGYWNIDSEETNEPDQIVDILKEFPFEDNSADEIIFFHAIEHIEERYHHYLLSQFHRVLKSNACLYISYPEFTKVAGNYITNYRGMRDFWKQTIYGLQRYPGDFHVSLMDTQYFVPVLQECGFHYIEYKSEVPDIFNTIVRCQKGKIPNTYENLIAKVGES